MAFHMFAYEGSEQYQNQSPSTDELNNSECKDDGLVWRR